MKKFLILLFYFNKNILHNKIISAITKINLTFIFPTSLIITKIIALILSLIFISNANTALAETENSPLNYREIRDLIQSGKLIDASKKISQQLQIHHKSTELLYFQCVILAKQQAVNKAISCFNDVIKTEPDMVEAYNNLGVLHASLGQDEQAKEWLDKGLARMPAIQALHQNIQNLQAKMANKAYSRALQAEIPLSDAPFRLTLLASIPSIPIRQQTHEIKAKIAEAAAPSLNTEDNVRLQVQRTIEMWASAWSEKNVSEYLSAYSSQFHPGKFQSREIWEDERKSRISGRRFIRVMVNNFNFEFSKNKVVARFTQAYESDNISTTNRKKLELVPEQGQWKIVRETVIGN